VRYTVIGEESTQPVEKTDSLRVPFITPFDTNFELCAQSEKLEITMSPDLEKSERWLLSTSIKCCSAWDLDVKSIELEETEVI
jgi:lipocalin